MSGLRLAAIFGFYPHKLGFCGPQESADTKAIFDFISGKNISEKKVRGILERFYGAFSYYKLIAEKNNIKDPFDRKVVSAYWIGNNLLDKVSYNDLKNLIHNEFSKKSIKIPKNSVAHHSFHVLVVGSVTDRIELKDDLLDLCRITWGEVIKKISNGNILVEQLGKIKEVFWDKNLVPEIKTTDLVAIHWNNIVTVINEKDVDLLCKFTDITVKSLKQ